MYDFKVTPNFTIYRNDVDDLIQRVSDCRNKFNLKFNCSPIGLILGPKEFLIAKYSKAFLDEVENCSTFKTTDKFTYMGLDVYLCEVDGISFCFPRKMASHLVDPEDWGA